MRYVMKQKLFCWGDDFTIKNEAGEAVFVVDGKVFTVGNKLSFQDMQGNELAVIRQKLLSWGPTRGGGTILHVRRAGQPEARHQQIYEQFGMNWKTLPVKKITATRKTPATL
jgi:uncharacterized protein YxjI